MKNTNRKAFQPANDPITTAVNKYRAARSNLLLAEVQLIETNNAA